MTRKDAPAPPATPPGEGEYARKLALAILSTLQTKGLLSSSDVDAILIAARRSAQGQPAPTPPTGPRPAPVPMQVTVQPSAPAGVSWHTETPPPAPEAQAPAPAKTGAKPEPKTPPVIDLKLD